MFLVIQEIIRHWANPPNLDNTLARWELWPCPVFQVELCFKQQKDAGNGARVCNHLEKDGDSDSVHLIFDEVFGFSHLFDEVSFR